MELLLRAIIPAEAGDVAHDLVVTADGDTPVGTVGEAMAAFLGLPGGPQAGALYAAESGVRLDPGGPVATSGLVSGDAVVVGSRPIVRPTAGKAPHPPAIPVGSPAAGTIRYHRGPHRPQMVQRREFEPLAGIPTRPEPRRLPLLGSLAPLGGGLALYAFSHQAEFLALVALTPLTMAAAWIEERRAGGRRYSRDAARFRQEVAERRTEATYALEAELGQRLQAAPHAGDIAAGAEARVPGLWARGREDPAFLTLRVGVGKLPSLVRCPLAPGGDPDLRREAASALAGHECLPGAPITVAMAGVGTLAVQGDGLAEEGLAASLLVQAGALHSPEDLVVVAALDPRRPLLRLARWMPHTRSLSSPLATAAIVIGTPAGDRLCTALSAVAERRLAAGAPQETTAQQWPWILAFLDESLSLDPAIVSRLLDIAPAAGIATVWLGGATGRIPRQARAVLTCRPADHPASWTASLWFRDPEKPIVELDLEPLDAGAADGAVRGLAPLVDAGASTATTAIPKTVTLFGALGLDDVPSEEERRTRLARHVVEHWVAEPGDRLDGPLGFTASGTMSLDLIGDGPHALVAGTSGSGKSELLAALVAGLVAHHPPTRLTLLFVDYKGGAACSTLRRAPHCVGYVTNLTGDLAQRALISLRAELTRRMALLEGRAKDLGEMARRFPDQAPPRLVIVVDEFATLVKEIPDFVPGIVDIAQRGRSLGIHLILATQRPAGAVSENILANTNARLCLRVLDWAESSSIIGTPEAAAIPVPLPGRGFARLGPGQVTPFQAAYVGAPAASGAPAGVAVRSFADAPVAQPARTGGGPGGPSQLDELLDAIDEATTALDTPTPRAPWLDELPAVIPLDTLFRGRSPRRTRWTIPIGEYDDPARQRQDTVELDLEDGGGLAVFGAAGAGKTTLLRSVAAVACRGAPDEGVVLVGIDFAGRGLRCLETLGPCAGVAAGDDLEAVTRLLAAVELEVGRRSLGGVGPPSPRILVLVDGYAAMRDVLAGERATVAMQGWLERFHRIVAEGRPVGVHTVLTVDRPGALGPVLSCLIARRLILRQVDERLLVELGVPSARARGMELGPGRGLLDASLLVQVACVSPAGTPTVPAGQEAALVQLGRTARRAGAEGALRTAPLREIEALPSPQPGVPSAGTIGILGVADVTHEAVAIDLEEGHFIVTGPPRSGRSTALRALVASLSAAGADVYLAGSALSPLRCDAALRRAAFEDPVALGELVAELAQLAGSDPPGGPPGQPAPPRVLVLDDADRVLDDPAAAAALDPLMRCGSLRLVAAMESEGLRGGYSQSDMLRQLRKVRRRLLLQPLDDAEIRVTLGRPFPLRPGLEMPPGRGVLLAGQGPVVVQVGLDASLSPSARQKVATPALTAPRRLPTYEV